VGVASCAASREATSSNTNEGDECLQILPHNASLQWADLKQFKFWKQCKKSKGRKQNTERNPHYINPG